LCLYIPPYFYSCCNDFLFLFFLQSKRTQIARPAFCLFHYHELFLFMAQSTAMLPT
jgi:hypothetical protein